MQSEIVTEVPFRQVKGREEKVGGNGSANHADTLSLLAAAGVGAAAMYLLDPARGRRRRHLVRDQLVRASHVAIEAAGATGRDLVNHVRGIAAVTRRRFSHETTDDHVLAERVRAEL